MSKLGKRYVCQTCGTTVLCLKAGPEDFTCCGAPVVELSMQELPSGD